MNKILLFLFCFSLTTTFSQTYNSKDLSVTQEDLKSTVYVKDSTANAFYIYEKGFVRYEKKADYNIVTDYSAKLKILNEKGYEHATINIVLYKSDSKKEKLSEITATTYNLVNGKVETLKLSPSKIFTKKNERYDMVTFTFSALKPGSVLVYSYTKESPFNFNFETWYFQEDIPKVYSEFISQIPGNYKYNIKKIGYKELDSKDDEIIDNCISFSQSSSYAQCIKTTYILSDIPAFKEEKYLTSKNNFINRIEFELIEIIELDGFVRKFTKTWQDVDKEFKRDESIGRQLRKSSLVKKLLPDSIVNITKPEDKAKAIFSFVKSNYTWNGDYQIYRDVNLKELIEDKTGNISSINILLHNILDEQGFKVRPALSSTRSNGLPTKLYPVLSEFNYLIVQLEIGKEKYLLDATEKYNPFGELPFRALNYYARLLNFDSDSEWIDLEASKISGFAIRDSISVNPDGTSTGHSTHIYKGHHAVDVRNELDNLSKDQIFSSISNPSEHVRVLNTVYSNRDLVEEPMQIEYELANSSQKINDLIYFNPFSFKFFDKNPFQLKERTYPIDFGYKQYYVYSLNIKIPENHSIVEVPENKLTKLPNDTGSLYFIVQKIDDANINIQCRITLSEAAYPTAYYPYLKEYLETIVTIQNGSYIVIKENI